MDLPPPPGSHRGASGASLIMAGQFREQVIKRATRSNGWAKVRAAHLEKFPACECCGKTVKYLKTFRLQVHHKIPFHVAPQLELDPRNLITLCSSPCCHFNVGHLQNWKSYNSAVVYDAEEWLEKYRSRP